MSYFNNSDEDAQKNGGGLSAPSAASMTTLSPHVAIILAVVLVIMTLTTFLSICCAPLGLGETTWRAKINLARVKTNIHTEIANIRSEVKGILKEEVEEETGNTFLFFKSLDDNRFSVSNNNLCIDIALSLSTDDIMKEAVIRYAAVNGVLAYLSSLNYNEENDVSTDTASPNFESFGEDLGSEHLLAFVKNELPSYLSFETDPEKWIVTEKTLGSRKTLWGTTTTLSESILIPLTLDLSTYKQEELAAYLPLLEKENPEAYLNELIANYETIMESLWEKWLSILE